jgi:hypothetical protein
MSLRNGSWLGRRAARRLVEFGLHSIMPGLSEQEFARIEAELGFEFAEDHRAFLAAGVPMGPGGWPDWRAGDPKRLRDQLRCPVEGLLFDVENAGFWVEDWGSRPAATADALAVAGHELAKVPTMVPIAGHRYLPSGRENWGHPVLSMYQSDVIVYGADLLDYIGREFGPDRSAVGPGAEATVPFWADVLDWNNDPEAPNPLKLRRR